MKIRINRNYTPDKAPALVTHLKLPEIRRPIWADNIRFPDDLTELGSQNVMELLGKYTQLWALVNQDGCRITQELLRYEAAEQQRVNEMIQRRPAINTLEKNKKDTVFGADHTISGYRRARKSLHIQKAAVDSYLAIFDKYINALSRELTRKGTIENIGPKYLNRN